MTDSQNDQISPVRLTADARSARVTEDSVAGTLQNFPQFREGNEALRTIDDDMRRPGAGCAALKLINSDRVDMTAKEGLLHSASATRVKLDCAPKP